MNLKDFLGIKIVGIIVAVCAAIYLVVGYQGKGGEEGTHEEFAPLDQLEPEERLNLKKNIVVLGVDERKDDVGRSDTLFVVMFDTDNKSASLLSIPRDTRVRIKGLGWDKINHAYSFGGRELTQRTVEELLGIRINNYVSVDFAGFQGLVDAIGGVDIDVEKDMYYYDDWDGFKIDLAKGRQHLDGKTAIQYVRYRDEDGDIGRIARQQHFLMAVYDKITSANMLLHVPGLAKQLTMMVKTDLPLSDMVQVGRAIHAMVKEKGLAMSMVNGEPTYIDGISYWIPDITDLREQMAKMQGAQMTETYRSAAELMEKEYDRALAAAREEEKAGKEEKSSSKKKRKSADSAQLSAEEKAIKRAKAKNKDKSLTEAESEEAEDSRDKQAKKDAKDKKEKKAKKDDGKVKSVRTDEHTVVVQTSPSRAKRAAAENKAAGVYGAARERTGNIVRLVNCSGNKSAGAEAISRLQQAGFTVLNGGSGEKIAQTVVISTTNNGAVISRLGAIPFAHRTRISRDGASDCDALIMLGEDYK